MSHRIVDLSGYMFSGKSAASDVLRECAGFFVPYYRTEFDLLRLGGGLIDLKNAVVDWSPMRSYAAICRFEKVMRKASRTPEGVAKLFTTGFGYAKRYPNILETLETFLREITDLEWETPWPYDDLEDGPIQTLSRKIAGKFGSVRYRHFRLAAKDRFITEAQRFVDGLVWQGVDESVYDTVILHNTLEPFDPGRNLDLLGAASKCIVVDRDARDIYATAVSTQLGFNDNIRMYRRISGAHDLRVFIDRHRIYRRNVVHDMAGVLRLRFEDLVGDYKRTLERLYEFLQIEPSRHVWKGRYFNPTASAMNVGLWRRKELSAFAEDFAVIDAECNG